MKRCRAERRTDRPEKRAVPDLPDSGGVLSERHRELAEEIDAGYGRDAADSSAGYMDELREESDAMK